MNIQSISWHRLCLNRGLSWLWGLAVASGCCGDDPGFPRTRTVIGETVTISTTRDIPIADGTVTRLDRQVTAVEAELLVEGRTLDLIVVDPELDLAASCTVSSGCYLPCSELSLVSESWALTTTLHELVHQVVDKSPVGQIDVFLSEGAASLFGSTRCMPEPESYELERLIGLPDGAKLAASEYTLAAKFLQYLRLEFGLEKLRDMLSSVGSRDTFESIDEVFIDTFGRSISEIEEGFDPSIVTFEDRNCADLVTLEPDENGVWEKRGPVLIEAPTTFNTFTGPLGRGLGVEVALDLPETAVYGITPEGAGVRLWLHTCTCGSDYRSFDIREEGNVYLSSGRYRLVLIDDSGDSQAEAGFRLSRI